MSDETWCASWRDGVALAGTPIWCDAPRRRELCFVSSAAAVGHVRHGQLVATAATLGLLGAIRSRRAGQPETELAVPLGRPFSLGELRLELFASGHCLGAASLVLETPSSRVCYAGAVHPAGTPLAGAGDVRRCDSLIVDAREATTPRPSYLESSAALAERATSITARGGAAVVLVETAVLALDVATSLAGLERRVLAHRRFADIARAARRLGHPAPALARAGGQLRPGAIVMWPADAAGAPTVSADRLPRGSELLAAPIARADRPALLAYIEQAGAREVMLTGGGDHDDLIAALTARGVRASALGPPEQLALQLE